MCKAERRGSATQLPNSECFPSLRSTMELPHLNTIFHIPHVLSTSPQLAWNSLQLPWSPLIVCLTHSAHVTCLLKPLTDDRFTVVLVVPCPDAIVHARLPAVLNTHLTITLYICVGSPRSQLCLWPDHVAHAPQAHLASPACHCALKPAPPAHIHPWPRLRTLCMHPLTRPQYPRSWAENRPRSPRPSGRPCVPMPIASHGARIRCPLICVTAVRSLGRGIHT